MTKRKRGYSRWSDEEEDALRLGVEVYGEGKWKRILTDAALAKYFVDRSNVDLKDKWRTMLCADKGTTRSAQALPEAEGAASVENSSGAYTTSPQDTPDSCDSASKQVLLKARGHRTSHQASAAIPPVSSQSDKALKSALEAAKRRHNGTSGDRAQLELQLELLTEVLKAVASHGSSHLLGGSELSSLQGRLNLLRSSCSSRPSRTPARFLRDLLGLLQPPELSELRAFATRQFEVLCLVDDACRRSLLPALSASPSISSPHAPPKLSFHAPHAQEPKPMRASARQAAKHAHHGAPGLQQKQQKQQRQHEVEDLRELLAVDALTMIREGSSSGDGSRGGGTSHEAPGDEEICSPRGRSPSRPSPPRHAPAPASAAPAPVQQQPMSPSKPSAPLPLLPASPSVSVPEGCGLDSTCVSAAMDKASELLNQCSAQDLLPVRDLGIHEPGSSINSATAADYGHATHQQHQHQPQQRQQQPLQPMQSGPFALVPTSAFPILSPLALADKALPSVLKSGLLPAGAEAWYPAYMAWVYSGLVHSGVR